MKKLVIVLLVIGAVAFVGYKAVMYYMPKAIADAIISETDLAMIPDDIQTKVDNLKGDMNDQVNELVELMEESDITVDDLSKLVNEIDRDQFDNLIEDLQTSSWETTDQAYDIVKEHLYVDDVDLEVFRSFFNDHATVENIREGIEALGESEFLKELSLPVMKETMQSFLKRVDGQVKE